MRAMHDAAGGRGGPSMVVAVVGGASKSNQLGAWECGIDSL